MKQLTSSGVENSREMNIPLSSKYCWRENNLYQQHKQLLSKQVCAQLPTSADNVALPIFAVS